MKNRIHNVVDYRLNFRLNSFKHGLVNLFSTTSQKSIFDQGGKNQSMHAETGVWDKCQVGVVPV